MLGTYSGQWSPSSSQAQARSELQLLPTASVGRAGEDTACSVDPARVAKESRGSDENSRLSCCRSPSERRWEIAMGEQWPPESHSISSFSFSEMQLGRPERCVGSGVHVCVSGSMGVRGLQVGQCMHAHMCHVCVCGVVCVCIHACANECSCL
jgi:hypothetical protein